MKPFTDEYAMLEEEHARFAQEETPLVDLKANELRPFLPARDFEVSKDFYLSLGCKLEWGDDNLALFSLAGQRFYLQRYYAKEWAENCMLHISVEDAAACHKQIQLLIRSGRHPGARVAAPKSEAYGAIVTYVWDPSGVLLHLAQWSVQHQS